MNTLRNVESLLARALRPAPLCALVGLLSASACSPAVLPVISAWQADLEPTAPSGPRGALGALAQSGRTQTSLQLSRGQAGSTYAWRIQSGSCTAPGDVVGGLAAYPTLEVAGDGTAEGATTLSRELSPDGTYSGWIYLVTGSDEAPVACGALERTR